MNISYRKEDVEKLRCLVCQDFLRMILVPGWQEELYREAEYEINNNTRLKDKYLPAYNKMREIGIEEYRVDDMDITLMSELVYSFDKGIIPISKGTRVALRALRTDKNTTSHSGKNEEDVELYRQCLVDLEDIKRFVNVVDVAETGIDDSKRLEFRKKYYGEINKLSDIIDEERIEIIQKEKEINKDVQKILDSDDASEEWQYIYDKYLKYWWKEDKDRFYKFVVKASDCGITNAHYPAALFYMTKRDIEEVSHRLQMMYESSSELSTYNKNIIINTIEEIKMKGISITDTMEDLLKKLKNCKK